MFGEPAENAVFLTAINRSKTDSTEFSLQVSAFAANDFEVVFTTEGETGAKEGDCSCGKTLSLSYGCLHFTLPPLQGVILREKRLPIDHD